MRCPACVSAKWWEPRRGEVVSGSSSVAERQLPKLNVAGSILAPRSIQSRKSAGLAAIASVMSSKMPSTLLVEIPLCGIERKDEISGDWFSCGKDKGHRLEHGLWNKSDRVD